MPEPNWKPAPGTRKAEQHKRATDARRHELQEKAKVRKRDGRCRFPLCGCYRQRYSLHVSHQTHKGVGGNPLQDRSDASRMVLVCAWRHKEGRFAIDRGTVKWEALSAFKGADGPIVWYVCAAYLPEHLRSGIWDYQIIGVESRPGWLEVPTEHQRRVLSYLATMQI